jgi:mono/diheme cytochrome c family protein
MRASLMLSLWLAACAEHPTYYADTKAIFDARCTSCHRPDGIAPFSLTTYEDAKAHAAAVRAAVQARTMPPWLAAKTDVAYRHDPSLDDAQTQTIVRWVEAGAPAGDPKATPARVAAVGGGLQRVDVQLAMPEPYLVQASPDEYRCFPIRWTEQTKRYITGFDATPGNPGVVHHAAVYLIPPKYADLPLEWDGEEAGPGYSCYGAPYGDRVQSFPIQLVSAWIPGYSGVSFPEGIGIEIQPDAMLVLQMHYNVSHDHARHEPAFDQTRLSFSVADSVEKRAVYAPFLDLSWVAGNMPIAAGEANVRHVHRKDPREFFQLFGVPLDTTNGFRIWAAMFHMHQLGQSGRVRVHRPKGIKTEILSLPRWDFHWQQEYYFAEPVAFGPADQLELECIFDNTEAAQPNGRPVRDVNWGERSEEEMCVVNLLISE